LEDRVVPDAGDTLQLALNTHIGPSAGTYTLLSEHLGDGPYGALDVDLYSFKAKAGEALTVTTAPAAGGTAMDTILRLFDANGNQLAYNDDYNYPSLYSKIEDYSFTTAGTYYVGVSGSPNWNYNPAAGGSGTPYTTPSTGDYRLDLSLFVPAADAAGDTLAKAQATGLGPTPGSFGVNASIGDGLYLNSDVDLYKVTANAGQVLTALTSLPPGGASMYTDLRVFDATGAELANNAFGNYPYSRLEYQFTAAGTYYVGVSGYPNDYYNPTVANSGYPASVGDYHLDLTLATPTADAAGDTIATAQATGLGPAAGTFSATAKIGDGLFPLQDVDLYQVQANAGQLLTAVTSLPTGGVPINGITMRVFDATGAERAISYYGYNSSSRIDYQFPSTGTYYVGLSGYPNYNYNPNAGGSGAPYYTPATGDYQLSLTVVTPAADAAGDTLATAQATGLGPAAGTFSATAKIGDGLFPLQDVDLYQVQAGAGQLLTAQTSLPTGGTYMNPVLRLFDSAGNQLGFTTYFYNNRLEYQFGAAGSYYVGVSGAYDTGYNPTVGGSGGPGSRGDYQLSLALTTPAADGAGDTLATAQATGIGPANGTFSASAHIGDGLYPLRDVDLYQFQAAAGQGLIAGTSQVAGGTFLFTTLRLFDAAGHPLASDTVGNYPNSAIRYVFSTSGTYYVGVSGSGNGSYDPTVAGYGGPLGSRGDYRLDLALVTPALDSVGDSLGTALATNLGPADGTYTMPSAHVGDGFWGARDVDVYSFTATAGQLLTATTSQPAGATPLYYGYLRLFDAAGHLLFSAYGFPYGGIQNYTFTAAGTYYLGVSGPGNYSYDPNVAGSGSPAYNTGDYRLDLTLVTPTPDAEGDTIATALATGLGPAAGTYGHTAHIGDGQFFARDVDLYRVDVTAGQLLRAMTSQPVGGQFMIPVLRLFDAAGNQLALNYSYYSANTSVEYQFGTAGTYYVGVSGYSNVVYNPNVGGSGSPAYSTGDYHLDLALITPTADAEGDTLAAALATGLGTADGSYSHTAKIGDGLYFGRDVDLYRVDAVANQVLTALTSVPDGGTPVGTYLRLFDAAGNELATGYDAFDYHIPAAGTYYLGVSGGGNTSYNPTVGGSGVLGGTGDYRLDLSLVTPTPDAVGDTIATALDTRLGPSAGTYTLPGMRIGDGLYVSRDVDMYSFRVQAGQVLTATTSLPTGGTPVDTVLTLYDSAGNYLSQGYPQGNSTSQLQYTFPAHGTYYLGVSAVPNYSYDPNTAGSGAIGGRGDYSLTLSLDKLVNAPVGGGGQHVQQVTGHAVWHHTVGLPSGGQHIDQVSINAWLDAGGTAHGTMSWITTAQQLPGGGGQAISGYPWAMRVDTLVIIGNTAHIEGVVVRSGQVPENVGSRVSWDVVVNGDGGDLLNGEVVDGGHFTIH
jgi:hypothetical protein